MVSDFHLSNAVQEMLLDEQRSIGTTDAELWNLSFDDFVSWLIRPN
jgi:hypothetical protein